MKSIIAFPISWILFSLGHLCSLALRVGEDSEYWVAFWYTPYNKLMLQSLFVQDWVDGNSPWFPWENPPKG